MEGSEEIGSRIERNLSASVAWDEKFFEKFSAVGREVEEHGEGEKDYRKTGGKKGKRDGNQGEDYRDHRAHRRTVDFTPGDFRVLDMLGEKNVSAHPEKSKADQDDMNSENADRQLILAEAGEQRGGERNERDKKEKKSINISQVSVYIFRVD